MRMNYAVCHVVASDSSNIHACSHIGEGISRRIGECVLRGERGTSTRGTTGEIGERKRYNGWKRKREGRGEDAGREAEGGGDC